MPRLTCAMALAGAIAAATAAPAAADQLTTIPIEPSGSITVDWHGDRAAGCEAAGLCDYHGTTTYPPPRRTSLVLWQSGREIVDFSGDLNLRGRTVARVTRELPSGSAAVCVDTAREEPYFTLDVRRAYRGRFGIAVENDYFPDNIASGRCAGPRLDDVARALPTATFALPRLERGGARVNLAGRFPLRAGPLVGEVVSTLVLRSRRASTRRLHDEPGPGGPARQTRMVLVDMSYAIERIRGAIDVQFSAAGTPACRAIDACGASGEQRYSLTDDRGSFEVFGFAPYSRRGRPSLERALEWIAGHGHVFGWSSLRHASGESGETFIRPDAPTCRDTLVPSGRPDFELFLSHHKPRMSLGPVGFEGGGDLEDDLLGTRCPGPTQSQVLAGTDPASAIVPIAAFTRRHLHALLGARGSFASRAYSGTSGARFEVHLVQRAASVHIGRNAPVVIKGSPTFEFAQRP